ncbi:hypothetical protein HY643_02400 [Candidatus Woesearchaeota archaeon]|nr:hypothetical protein [Candidatus Woesearchaeota archaeon]
MPTAKYAHYEEEADKMSLTAVLVETLKEEKFSFDLAKLGSVVNKKMVDGNLELTLANYPKERFFQIGLMFGTKEEASSYAVYGLAKYAYSSSEGKKAALKKAKKVYEAYEKALREGNYQINLKISPVKGKIEAEIEVLK